LYSVTSITNNERDWIVFSSLNGQLLINVTPHIYYIF
jgi:hypothetical protein